MPRSLLLGEGQTTEQRLRQLHRPALLHILGHGIVRGNEDCLTAAENPGCQFAKDPAASVMSLSAIVLEEAYGRGGGGNSSQDGLLTALDLQGSEMLVLSQCRMADGIPSTGDGVFGMRRAAAIAGVKTFVAPLWKTADSTQQALMQRFYQELSGGSGRVETLRQAQLQLLRTRATASLLQWAPVILSGNPGPLPQDLFARRPGLSAIHHGSRVSLASLAAAKLLLREWDRQTVSDSQRATPATGHAPNLDVEHLCNLGVRLASNVRPIESIPWNYAGRRFGCIVSKGSLEFIVAASEVHEPAQVKLLIITKITAACHIGKMTP